MALGRADCAEVRLVEAPVAELLPDAFARALGAAASVRPREAVVVLARGVASAGGR